MLTKHCLIKNKQKTRVVLEKHTLNQVLSQLFYKPNYDFSIIWFHIFFLFRQQSTNKRNSAHNNRYDTHDTHNFFNGPTTNVRLPLSPIP